MDEKPTSVGTQDRSENSTLRFSNGSSLRRSQSSRPNSTLTPDGSILSSHQFPFHHISTLTIVKDNKGYGMKVSGDNPVFVQSVKDGGAAEKAGLHSGDKILKVNGTDVTHSTHIEVVEFIKSSLEVHLTVQQRIPSTRPPLSTSTPSSCNSNRCSSPMLKQTSLNSVTPTHTNNVSSIQRPLYHHHSAAPVPDRITAPQPVDHEKKKQLESQKEHTLRLMLEKDQRYVEAVRSELVKCDSTDEQKIKIDLMKAERRVCTLQEQLDAIISNHSFNMLPLSANNGLIDVQSPTSPLPLHHQRTKSNPDKINNNTCKLLPTEENTSGSLSDLRSMKRSKGGVSWNVESPFTCTPPGTPPPPNLCRPRHKENSVPYPPKSPPPPDEVDDVNKDDLGLRGLMTRTDLPSPSATIISMEDDMSDQDSSQLGDLGPFKSIARLWEHNINLAVFLNYVLSNCDPSSILFYLLTDLYKEGNIKEMRKWAYEIHSSFLGPDAPLRLTNVDDIIAHEINEVLRFELDKEEILRKVFWKARMKAKEELNEQLADFQQKKTAGLGTMYGPSDNFLDECILDKSKEQKMIELYLLPKLEPLIEEMDKETVDYRKYTTAAAYGTVLSKVFGIRGQHFNSLLERCPTFVSKEKSFKARLICRSRKVNFKGHHFIAHQYFSVIYCRHCQDMIRGIGPQGYQCSNCCINIHRSCVKVLEESCPGPHVKRDRGNDRISKFMDKIRSERGETKRKPSFLNVPQIDRMQKQTDDREDGSLTDNESVDKSSCSKARFNNLNNFADSVRESEEKQSNKSFLESERANSIFSRHLTPSYNLSQRCKTSCTSINRSESYKERLHQKRPIRDKRKTSDPNLSKTNTDVEIDSNIQYPYPSTNSGSSSNSNLSTRSLDSPSNSLEIVRSTNKGSCENTTVPIPSAFCLASNNLSCSTVNDAPSWDSDLEPDLDPPDASIVVPLNVLKTLSKEERKRQEVINELYLTERSHVRGLKVLDQLFYQPMRRHQILPEDYLQLLFPNLEQISIIHSQFNNLMKIRKKENPVVSEVGDILLKTFDGEEGRTLETAAATFCCRQKKALERLKEKRSKKDSLLHSFLKEAECNPMCRRLQLQDIIPTEFQRLTKYPLLFETLAESTKNNNEEAERILAALKRSKEVLKYVDDAVEEAADQDQVAEIQRKLDFDKSESSLIEELKNLEISRRKIIYHGCLNLKNSKNKFIEVYALLLENVIILFQRMHEKYLLQNFTITLTNSFESASPIIKKESMLIRQDARDHKELYLIDNTPNGKQMYILVAANPEEGDKWLRRISDAADSHKKDGKQKAAALSVHDLDHCANGSESPIRTKENDGSYASGDTNTATEAAAARQSQDDGHGYESPPKKSGDGGVGGTSHGLKKKKIPLIEPPRLTTEVPLIEPSQVLISQQPVLTAEPVITPLEKVRRNYATIKELLCENNKLVADILHLTQYDSEATSGDSCKPEAANVKKEATELVRSAINEVDQLTALLNECLRVTDENVIVAANCEVNVGGANSMTYVTSGTASSIQKFPPGVPVSKLKPITQALRSCHTMLLTASKEREEERERQRQELQRFREQLHAMHETQQRMQRISDLTQSPNESAKNCSKDRTIEESNKDDE